MNPCAICTNGTKAARDSRTHYLHHAWDALKEAGFGDPGSPERLTDEREVHEAFDRLLDKLSRRKIEDLQDFVYYVGIFMKNTTRDFS